MLINMSKQLILDTVEDVASNFLYYDRKEDEDLPWGSIEKAVSEGVISKDEIVEHFRQSLTTLR